VFVCVFVSQPLIGFPSQLPVPPLHVGEQLPPVQTVLPFGLVQSVPQAPQCASVVERLVSQPLLRLASQLPKPSEHSGVHTPETHEVVPFGFVQPVPHAPQFDRLVSRFVSQPLLGLLSQLANPVLHEGVQAPAVHVVGPLAFEQALPHAPQLDVVVSAVSHPFARLPSQLP
jgi:hypothetical protein